MKTMTSRQKKILELLTDAEGWITAKQISMRLNVSDRTIKTEIPVLSEMLVEEGIRIISGRGKGFCVGREDRGKLIEFLNRNQPENLFPDILMTLLEVDGIELEELCDTYYTSVSYMEGKLREIRNFFIQEGNFLTLVRIKSRLSVVGSEKKKRQMMQMVIMDHQKMCIRDRAIVHSIVCQIGGRKFHVRHIEDIGDHSPQIAHYPDKGIYSQ